MTSHKVHGLYKGWNLFVDIDMGIRPFLLSLLDLTEPILWSRVPRPSTDSVIDWHTSVFLCPRPSTILTD